MALTKAEMAEALFNQLGLNKREARELLSTRAIVVNGRPIAVDSQFTASDAGSVAPFTKPKK